MRWRTTMGRFVAGALVALGLSIASGGTASAEGGKIGVIDSQRIFAEYQDARDAEAVFQEEMRAWQQELGEMEREILGLREQIRSQSLLRSKESLDALQAEHDDKLTVYEARKTEILDPEQGQAVSRNQELSAPINDQITTVVERLGSEGDFDIILDRSTINIVYLTDEIDLTDRVLEELEQGEGE